MPHMTFALATTLENICEVTLLICAYRPKLYLYTAPLLPLTRVTMLPSRVVNIEMLPADEGNIAGLPSSSARNM